MTRCHVNNFHRLLSHQGLPRLLSTCGKLKFKGKGREQEDLDKLLNFFQLWGHDLFPKLKFQSFIDRTEKICKEKRLRVFHTAVVQETKRRAMDMRDAEEYETRAPVNINKADINLDEELENAIKERFRQAGVYIYTSCANEKC